MDHGDDEMSVLPRGPLRRPRENRLFIQLQPKDEVVENAIKDTVSKLGWVFKEKRSIFRITVMVFERP